MSRKITIEFTNKELILLEFIIDDFLNNICKENMDYAKADKLHEKIKCVIDGRKK